jgi:hypothetical protein
MKPRLDMEKIARGLGGARRGAVQATGGYFGAHALAAEVAERFKVPDNGGRSTDPGWTERRQVPLRPETLRRLETLSAKIHAESGTEIHPMQLAALLLEKLTRNASDAEALGLFKNPG